jgi:N-acetylmuramoyl-L-alanine amidase
MFAIENGRLMIDGKPAAFVPTPNQGGRLDPTLIVLHDTAGRLVKGSSVAWFADPKAKASAHIVVERDGSVTQVVSFDRVAWHAGSSSWRGRSNCNAFAVGIEIVNPGKLTGTPAGATAWFGESFGPESGIVRASTPAHGDGCWMPYTEAQLRTVEQLVGALGREYPIGEVVAHHDISPGRKVDTTPLMDWPRMRAVRWRPARRGQRDGSAPGRRHAANGRQRSGAAARGRIAGPFVDVEDAAGVRGRRGHPVGAGHGQDQQRRRAKAVQGTGALAPSARPGKVDTGFPIRTCTQSKNLGRIPIPSNRDAF